MVNRVALGKLGDGTSYGLEVSKPTFDVLTAADKDKIFSTKWSHGGSIYLSGTVSLSSGGGAVTVTFPGTLGYVPFALVLYATLGPGAIGRYIYSSAVNGPVGPIYTHNNQPKYDVYADRIVMSSVFTTALNVRYIILRIPGV